MKTDQHASEILQSIANNENLNGHVRFEEILVILGDRAFGIALLFFALPSALPLSTIPGVSFIFSLPILFIAVQMALLRKTIWLPKVIAKKTISHATICKMARISTPYLQKIEKLLTPRLLIITSRFMEVINGLLLVVLSLLLMMPIPLSNFIFSAMIIIFSLGLIEKDGIFIIAGYIGTFLYVSFVYGIILATIKIIF